MTFFVFEQGDDVGVGIEYYTALFKPETIGRLAAHLNNIVKVVTNEPSIKLKDIEMIYRFDNQSNYIYILLDNFKLHKNPK